ncbi:DUF2141 domain-containing protein [bacterium SCSIO 12741]|nr:DUF2141 domain-containing protein [bacterium SCSIO 12741]
MKTLKLLIILCLSILTLKGHAQTPVKKLTISYSNLSTSDGKIMVLIQNESEKDVSKMVLPVYNNEASVTLFLKPGKYGVTAYHDVNGNEELDTNFLGVPTEPYGFSNDARGTLGKPDYQDVLFDLSEDQTITFELK